MPSSEPHADEDFPLRFGPYLLLKRIAVGGMAEIFLARDRDHPEPLVVKRLLPHYAQHPDMVQMFLDEVRAVSSLSHPNIVQVYNCGSIGRSFFLSMEYLFGLDLRYVCRSYWSSRQHIPRAVLLNAVSSVARALAYAHEKVDPTGRPLRLTHRDVSPHNIFACFDGTVKLLDFGVAKAENALHHTRTGALVGKVGYMSPEQARGEKMDHRSDIFSLGVVMWELAAGRRFLRVKELGEFEVLRRLCEDEFPPPSQTSMAPPQFDRIVARALAKDPMRRYQSATELLADLEECANELGVDISDRALAGILRKQFADSIEQDKKEYEDAAQYVFDYEGSNPSSSAPLAARSGELFAGEPFPDAERTEKSDRRRRATDSYNRRFGRQAPPMQAMARRTIPTAHHPAPARHRRIRRSSIKEIPWSLVGGVVLMLVAIMLLCVTLIFR